VTRVNPFELARAELFTPWDVERVLSAVDELLRTGFVAGEARYRLFGGRIGRVFSMSLGLPLLGGGTPVLRGRVRDGTGSTTLDVRVGARHEIVILGCFWTLLTLVGGGYQLYLQCRRVLAGEAGWSAVGEVLPGIAIMSALVIGGIALWRRGQRPAAVALIGQLRAHVGAEPPTAEAQPFSARPTA
jgi:hypothetical protein